MPFLDMYSKISFKFNQSIKAKKHKIDIRSKIQKMDIQDAEFEESPDE